MRGYKPAPLTWEIDLFFIANLMQNLIQFFLSLDYIVYKMISAISLILVLPTLVLCLGLFPKLIF
jgi:hypothetical protein